MPICHSERSEESGFPAHPVEGRQGVCRGLALCREIEKPVLSTAEGRVSLFPYIQIRHRGGRVGRANVQSPPSS